MLGLGSIVAAVAACGDVASTPEADGGSEADAGDPPADAGDPPADAADAAEPRATLYRGMLAETTPVLFGGDPFCEYTMTLKDISVEVAVLPSGEVTGAAVQDVSVEEVVPPCDLGTIPPLLQTYVLASAAPSDTGVTLTMAGAKGNKPVTTLLMELTASGADYAVGMLWTRTDQPPPLDWQVIASIMLTAR